MFRNLFFLLLLTFSISSCTTSSFKDVYCFLSGTDLSLDDNIYLCAEDSVDLSEIDYKVHFVQKNNFKLQKIKAGEFLLFPKEILTKLRAEEKLTAVDIYYIAENESYILFTKRDRFTSHNYGEVGKIGSQKLSSGQIKVKGKLIKTPRLKYYQTNQTSQFPLSCGENLNEMVGENNVAECFVKLKGNIIGSSINLINNFKSQERVSLLFEKNEIKFNDTTSWNGYYFEFQKMDKFVKTDEQIIYLLNTKSTPFQIKDFDINVFDPHSGDSKFRGQHISSYAWSYTMGDQKWQKAPAWTAKNKLRCRKISPRTTGVHFSSALATKPLEKGDEFTVDFQYQTENESDSITFILKIINKDAQVKQQFEKIITVAKSWNKESITVEIPENVTENDRVFFYFKNDSDQNIYVTDICAGVLRKNIICN